MIAFSSDRGLLPTSSGSHIYVMDADGSDVRQVTSGTTYDSDPSFSPDGSRIVFDRSTRLRPVADLRRRRSTAADCTR